LRLAAFLLACALSVAHAQDLPSGTLPSFNRIQPGAAGSAYDTAKTLLAHLAEGNIEAAAALSNAPERRRDVLLYYRETVGEEEFKRIFSRYLDPANALIAEVAIGPRRLLLWKLGEANDHIAGQFYVEADGRFLMDDVPGEERNQLRSVLEAARAGKIRF
jgi:hypothetical protein